MCYYLFEDHITGEEFIVAEDSLSEAFIIANEFFEDPCFLYEIDEEEAEASGLDWY